MDLRAKLNQIESSQAGTGMPRSPQNIVQRPAPSKRTLNRQGERINGYGNSMLGASTSTIRPITSSGDTVAGKAAGARQQVATSRRPRGITPSR